MSEQVKSKQRITDHGEVFTSEREVNAMLDLVKEESERIESKFLEPACGTGNFLVEILRRKLTVVESFHSKNQLDFEKYSIIAFSSIYGVDILEDNIKESKKRMLDLFIQKYDSFYINNTKKECKNSIKFILDKNIIHGDSLTQKLIKNNKDIIFSEWIINNDMIQIKEYTFSSMLGKKKQRSLFDKVEKLKTYPAKHFLRLSE